MITLVVAAVADVATVVTATAAAAAAAAAGTKRVRIVVGIRALRFHHVAQRNVGGAQRNKIERQFAAAVVICVR
jgi:hypothetical protein